MQESHILVDGYSILHQWEEFRPLLRRNLPTARQALILLLTQFHDCRGGKMTLVFDGRSLPKGGESIRTSIEVVYSKQGQTADAVIEKMVGQSLRPQQFIVATEDYAEQNIVESLGGRVLSADAFHSLVKSELEDLEQVLENISLRNQHFGKGRHLR